MKKKSIAFVLAAILMLISACGGVNTTQGTPTPQTAAPSDVIGNFNKEGFPIVNKKITLRVFQYVTDAFNGDFSTMDHFIKLEEMTNVHAEFEEVRQSDWDTKLNLMLASGDYADVIIRGTTNIDEYGITQGIIIPLDGLIEEYMPIYSERLKMDNVGASIPAADGKSYYIGYISAQNINTNAHAFINQTWLDKLGLEVPKTIDELTDVFRSFKANEKKLSPTGTVIPYQSVYFSSNGLLSAFASWGIPVLNNLLMIDDNHKVKSVIYEDGFRECIEWLNMLYREGLIDPECISQDNPTYTAKLSEGSAGYFWFWRLIANGIPDDVIKDYKVMLPVAADGYQVKLHKFLEIPTQGALVTKANKYVPETLRWLDCQLETEIMFRGLIGDKDKYWFYNDDNKIEEIVIDDGRNRPVNASLFFAPGSYHFSVFKMPPHRIEKVEYCQLYTENNIMESIENTYLNLIKVTTEERSEITLLFTEIDKFVKESVAAFITKGVTDSQWDSFLKTLDSLKMNRYAELHQIGYDNYLNN